MLTETAVVGKGMSTEYFLPNPLRKVSLHCAFKSKIKWISFIFHGLATGIVPKQFKHTTSDVEKDHILLVVTVLI